MRSSTLISIILSFSVVSIQPYDDDGISSYCEKSRRQPFWYDSTPIECCNDQGRCDKYIKAGETKYGLTNPDPNWSRRECSCDSILYECVMKNKTSFTAAWTSHFGFRKEKCFRKKRTGIGKYEFVSFLDTLQKPKVLVTAPGSFNPVAGRRRS